MSWKKQTTAPSGTTVVLPHPKRLVFIGIGGIGSLLAPFIVRHAAFTPSLKDVEIVFVDGDEYEAKNAVRQNVGGLRNKAEVAQALFEDTYPFLKINAIKGFIGPESKLVGSKLVIAAEKILQEGDWVFGCVDKNVTRLVVSQQMQKFSEAVLIDGGNDLTDGSVQLHIRYHGMDLTPPIEKFQPSIAQPQDRPAYDLSCEELAASGTTQIMPTNATAALMMYLVMWRLLENPVVSTEIASVGYFDITGVISNAHPVIAFQSYPFTSDIDSQKEIPHGS